jgi:hypothetical protein
MSLTQKWKLCPIPKILNLQIVTERPLFPTLLWSSFYSFILALLLFSFSYFSAMTLFYSVFTICLLILDGALRLRVWITRRYFPLICYSFNCQQILFIHSLPAENICFCLLYSQRNWTRLDPFFRVFLPMLRVQNQKV